MRISAEAAECTERIAVMTRPVRRIKGHVPCWSKIGGADHASAPPEGLLRELEVARAESSPPCPDQCHLVCGTTMLPPVKPWALVGPSGEIDRAPTKLPPPSLT